MSAVAVDYAIEGEGPALYLIHGIGSRKITWAGLIPHLKDQFTCISYDLRGHGSSPIPPTPYTLEELVEDLEALRAKLGHHKIHVMGHSLGGMIAPAYARAYPDHTLSVGLLSTAAGRTDEDRAKLAGVRAAMSEQGIAPVLNTLIERWYTDAFIASHPDAIQARLQQVINTPPEVFLSVFDVYAQTEMAPWLHELNHPCLVMTGELDGGCPPRLNRFMAETLPDAELVILDGLKHSILIEAPSRVVPPVRAFLLKNKSIK